MIKAEEQRQQQYAHQTGEDSGKDACRDGFQVPFQRLNLLIQRDGQADGGRRQQVADVFGTLIIDGIGHTGRQQKHNGENNGQQQGIEDGQFQPFFDVHSQEVASQRDKHAQVYGF